MEVTTLIILGLNYGYQEMRDIGRFVKSIGPDIPWHVTQFYPTYKIVDKPRTPVETLRSARKIGMEEGLSSVYEGNVPGEGGENTYCHACGSVFIERHGVLLTRDNLLGGRCPDCGTWVGGVWM